MKPLKQSDFKMQIIEDLGTQYSSSTSNRKYRRAIFACTKCKTNFETITQTAKAHKQTMCKSCGRKHIIEISTKHGDSYNRLNNIYRKMKQRCANVNNKNYGGRGIKVSNKFSTYYKFKNWALANGYTDNLTIDRIDNDGNYKPSNCRWTTCNTQSANQRVRKTSKSGHTGIIKLSITSYRATLSFNHAILLDKVYPTLKEAIETRNKFIIDNNLPHTLNVLHSS